MAVIYMAWSITEGELRFVLGALSAMCCGPFVVLGVRLSEGGLFAREHDGGFRASVVPACVGESFAISLPSSLWWVAAHTMVALWGLESPSSGWYRASGVGIVSIFTFQFPNFRALVYLIFLSPRLSPSQRVSLLFYLKSWDDDAYYPS